MKKTLMVAILLVFGFSSQALAVGNNSQSQGNAKPSTTQEEKAIATTPAQETQTGNAVNTNEQNAVRNQGENTQIQTQEQNTVQTQDSGVNKANKGNSANPSGQTKSPVANAVQTMLQIAERNSGIGQQVKIIAQNQNQNQAKLEQNVEKIKSRGIFAKFFVGADYGEIKDAQKTLEQNKEQIRQLNQIRTQLSNEGDQQQLMEQIKVLRDANQGIENSISDAQGGFSLFGWLSKMVS